MPEEPSHDQVLRSLEERLSRLEIAAIRSSAAHILAAGALDQIRAIIARSSTDFYPEDMRKLVGLAEALRKSGDEVSRDVEEGLTGKGPPAEPATP